MGQKFNRQWCPSCRSYVLGMKQTPNHILHLLLTIVTFGVWIVFWAIASLGSDWRGYKCPNCGSETKGRGPR